MLTTTAITTTALSPYIIRGDSTGELLLSFPGVTPDIMDVAAVDVETGLSGHATGYLVTQTLGNMPMAAIDGNDSITWDQSSYSYVMRGEWSGLQKVFEYIQWRRPGSRAYYYHDDLTVPVPHGVTVITHLSDVHGVINMVWNTVNEPLSWVRQLPLTRQALVISTHHDYELQCGRVAAFSPITQWYRLSNTYSGVAHTYAIYTMSPGTVVLTPSQITTEYQHAREQWYHTTLLPGIAPSLIPLWHLGPIIGARC